MMDGMFWDWVVGIRRSGKKVCSMFTFFPLVKFGPPGMNKLRPRGKRKSPQHILFLAAGLDWIIVLVWIPHHDQNHLPSILLNLNQA
jgi:hypothetical protein